jgi:hypothetical protein
MHTIREVVLETVFSSRASTVALRVVGGDEKGTRCLGDINTGTLELRVTALATTTSNCKRQTSPLVRENVT